MIFATIGDIAGNANALAATLHELDGIGIQVVVNTGDSVVGGPDSGGVVDQLQSRSIRSVQGHFDRLLPRFRRKEAQLRQRLDPELCDRIAAAYDACSAEVQEYIRGLPHTLTVELEGISVVVCHGTLTRQSEFLGPETPIDVLRRQREMTPAGIVVCGHGSGAFVRDVDGTLFVHPGSLGNAPDGRAHYALVSTEERPFTAELCSIPFTSSE